MHSAAFRFDEDTHIYTDLDGRPIPNITTMLARTGWVDDDWFTEESAARGTAVHQLCAQYDLGALDPTTQSTRHRGYLLAHVAAMQCLRPAWDEIEVPHVSLVYGFGGRPDRVGTLFQLRTVCDLKSGAYAKSHAVQTALQAILVSGSGVPAHAYQRLALYLKPNGRYKVEAHVDRRDLDEALRVIKVCCS